MLFNLGKYSSGNLSEIIAGNIIYIFFFSQFLIFPFNIIAQETTHNNYEGIWSNDQSWENGSSPGTSNIQTDIIINGTIFHYYDISTQNNDLTVNDTLLIFGNLTLGNNADLSIANGGVLIVFGDYTSKNKVDVSTGGLMVVMGEFEQMASNKQGSFSLSSGSVFIYDQSPEIKTGPGYTDLNCPEPSDYPTNCAYGNESDFSAEPIFSNVFSGAFSINSSAPLEICGPSDSVVLSVEDVGDSYQWYFEGNPVPGANSSQYTARDSGNYHIIVSLNSIMFTSNTIAYTFLNTNSISFPAIPDQCENDPAFLLNLAWPEGGTYTGNGITSSPVFDPSHAGTGTHTITYSYTFFSGCTQTRSQPIKINPVPSPAVTGPVESCLDGNGVFSTTLNTDHSYLWSYTNAVASSPLDANQISLEFNTAGTSVLRLTETNDITGCSTTTSEIIINVYDKPLIGEIQSPKID